MRFKVVGVDRESGDASELVVEADDFRAAEDKANNRGLLVEKVLPAQAEASSREVPSESTAGAPASAAAAKKPAEEGTGATIAALVVLGILLVAGYQGCSWACSSMFALPDDPASVAAREASRERSEAVYMAHDFVRRRLRSPSTASFPWESDHNVSSIGDGRYRVSGYVDAENGFGATIRNQWSVELERVSEMEWRAIDVTID